MRIGVVFLPAVLLLCTVSAWADKDEVNNIDLQPTPDEVARASILRRWPDATDIDVADLDDDVGQEELPEKPDDPAAKPRDADAGEEVLKNDEKGADLAGLWTMSVQFTSKGTEYEAFVDDAGRIYYVYETIPIDKIPDEVKTAARTAVKDGNFEYCDRMRDESGDTPVLTYLVGVGKKEVTLDKDARLVSVEDIHDPEAPPEGVK